MQHLSGRQTSARTPATKMSVDSNNMEWEASSCKAASPEQHTGAADVQAVVAKDSRTTNMAVNFVLLLGHMAKNYELEKADFLQRLKLSSTANQIQDLDETGANLDRTYDVSVDRSRAPKHHPGMLTVNCVACGRARHSIRAISTADA